MGTAKLPRGFGAGPAPGATATDCALSTGSVTSAAASPQLSRPIPSPAFLDREFAVGRVYFSDFAKLLLLFLRSFLGFSLLRHHKPPSKVKEASTAPVELRRAIRPSGPTRRRISCRSTRRATQNHFSARNSCSFARANNIAQKIFSSIAHIKQSSKKFLAKNNSARSIANMLNSALSPLRRREFTRRCARANNDFSKRRCRSQRRHLVNGTRERSTQPAQNFAARCMRQRARRFQC